MNYSKTITATALAFLFAHVPAQAQDSETKPDVEITTTSKTQTKVDWGDNERDGRARLGMSGQKVPGKITTMQSTTKIKQTIQLESRQHSTPCESDIDLEYYQKDTITEVRTLISSANCSEFDANYELRIVYFDDSGKLQHINADENWPKGHTGQHTTSYTLAPDSELRRVSSKSLTCTCTGGMVE